MVTLENSRPDITKLASLEACTLLVKHLSLEIRLRGYAILLVIWVYLVQVETPTYYIGTSMNKPIVLFLMFPSSFQLFFLLVLSSTVDRCLWKPVVYKKKLNYRTCRPNFAWTVRYRSNFLDFVFRKTFETFHFTIKNGFLK